MSSAVSQKSVYPDTEGIKYADSELKRLPYILQLTYKVKPTTIFDGFSGTTRVSQAFAQLDYQVAFEEFRGSDSGRFMAVKAIEGLIAKTNAKHVILSYSSGGCATVAEVYEMLSQSGKILDFVKVDYRKNVIAAMRWTNEWTQGAENGNQEYLFLIERK